MKLLHLTAVGPNVVPASLSFAPRLTVIYGASETGKTYIIEALDFMFGAQELRQVPEDAGYQRMLLGMEFDDGEVVTLSRNLRGGRIEVFDGDLRTPPTSAAERTLLSQHKRDNPENISHFLLDRLGIAGSQLRKNQRNSLLSMSFRHIAHLVLVDEERMQTKFSVIESGIPTSRTTERSAFKLVLQGEDDSGLTQGEDPTDFRRVNAGQLQILDRLVVQLEGQLDGAPSLEECQGSLARVIAAIQERASTISDQVSARDILLAQRGRLQADAERQRAIASEQATLLQRFLLLDDQYGADLERLQLIKSAGTLLGYFDADRCVFCGADAQHQDRDHSEYETVRLAESVDAEAARTLALKRDLGHTLAAVQTELEMAETRLRRLHSTVQDQSIRIEEMDDALRPSQFDLNELVARRSQLERWIGLRTRVSEVDQLRAIVAREEPERVEQVTEGFAVAAQVEFAQTIRRILREWEVPGADDSSFTFVDGPDVVIQQRKRDTRGKGMRSLLHAGFAVALSEYCLQRDLPHPGFLALDTPVLTYRDADVGDTRDRGIADEEFVSGSVADAFYRYLATQHTGQVIVLENQTPPAVHEPGCSTINFSGNAASGRSGFYPPARTSE